MPLKRHPVRSERQRRSPRGRLQFLPAACPFYILFSGSMALQRVLLDSCFPRLASGVVARRHSLTPAEAGTGLSAGESARTKQTRPRAPGACGLEGAGTGKGHPKWCERGKGSWEWRNEGTGLRGGGRAGVAAMLALPGANCAPAERVEHSGWMLI